MDSLLTVENFENFPPNLKVVVSGPWKPGAQARGLEPD